ncbi:MAG: cyclodeaminase/cyclohydrolase family protein [Pseudomonadota bacterium]|nr:cyclodeaminase/cyclohydrolase family protein [Pseudomonadota bacterium]
MSDAGLTQWLSNLADRTPAPGGGALACALAAQATALFAMVARYSKGPRFGHALIERLDREQSTLMQLAADDQTAFEALNSALRRTKNDPDRHETLLRLSRAASVPPMTAFEDTLDLAQTFLAVANYTNKNLATDTLMVADIYASALRSLTLNVLVNLNDDDDGTFGSEMRGRLAHGDETLKLLTNFADDFGRPT